MEQTVHSIMRDTLRDAKELAVDARIDADALERQIVGTFGVDSPIGRRATTVAINAKALVDAIDVIDRAYWAVMSNDINAAYQQIGAIFNHLLDHEEE